MQDYISVPSVTLPAQGLRNFGFTAYIVGSLNPTPISLPEDTIGGKLLNIYCQGTNALSLITISPRRVYGGFGGVGGTTSYLLNRNQFIQLLSAGTSGWVVVSTSNQNTTTSAPAIVQTLAQNTKMFQTTITGAAVNGTFTFATGFVANPSFTNTPFITLTAVDPILNHTMVIKTQSNTDFTYVSLLGTFPASLNVMAVGV